MAADGRVAFVLLIACVNVANLLVARAPSVGKEWLSALLLAQHVGKLFSQFLVESLSLALIGGAWESAWRGCC